MKTLKYQGSHRLTWLLLFTSTGQGEHFGIVVSLFHRICQALGSLHVGEWNLQLFQSGAVFLSSPPPSTTAPTPPSAPQPLFLGTLSGCFSHLTFARANICKKPYAKETLRRQIPPSLPVSPNTPSTGSWEECFTPMCSPIFALQRNPRADLLQNGLVGSPCSPRDSQESSPTPQFKSINSSDRKSVV